MKPSPDKLPIQWHESLDSTNSELRRRLGSIDNMSVIAARHQSAGRGQGAHTWLSPAGQNLTFSLYMRFGPGACAPLAAAQGVRITHMATTAVCEYLSAQGVQARIKWPNDIWVADRKICGMLIENILEADMVAHSIVGIGFNLNQTSFDTSLPNPVSLRQLTDHEYRPEAELAAIYKTICRQTALLDTDDGRIELEKRFNERLFHLEKSKQEQLRAAIEDFEANR